MTAVPILAIDTSTADLVAGIVTSDGRVAAERIITDTRRHNELLTPTIASLLDAAGYTYSDLTKVVAGCGPGPFTGLRVGMVTAAATAQALGIPVAGVVSHDAIAEGLPGRSGLVVTDARRREVYYSAYRDGERIAGPEVARPADVPVIEGVRAVAGKEVVVDKLPQYAHAERFDLGPTAARLVAAPPAPLTPLYLRRPDAVPPPLRHQIRLGRLNTAHAERLGELEAQLFASDSPWSTEAFREELASWFYVGAFDGERLVGYAGLGPAGADAEVHTIGVDPAYQGRGIGRKLMGVLLEQAGEAAVFLEVRTDNDPALRLYRSLGFEELGVRKNYYQPSGADAYVMRRPGSEK